MLWCKPRQRREATKMTDDGCHLLTDLVVWDMKVDFVWFINIKICDIAHIWSIESQFLLIKITFIQTSIHSKYWQVSTHMPKKTGIGVIFPTLPPQLKHLVMGIIDFLTSFSTLCPERPRTLYRRYSLREWKCVHWSLEWVLLKDCRPWLIVFPAGSEDVYDDPDFGLLSGQRVDVVSYE